MASNFPGTSVLYLLSSGFTPENSSTISPPLLIKQESMLLNNVMLLFVLLKCYAYVLNNIKFLNVSPLISLPRSLRKQFFFLLSSLSCLPAFGLYVF